ncbi:hypothetical protein CBR_g50841 [Chara braunii]|uniref:Uncharacterized protein n=1 Tax=Chara braunii TaxID=69332 RepID=A0A388M7D5_CHABU|nr:hypothetical protein CBR_g50841 [Chara braunii]|eukprot:GBG90494.1 hypothetical protein CBR_g50841 [Chara braunii]
MGDRYDQALNEGDRHRDESDDRGDEYDEGVQGGSKLSNHQRDSPRNQGVVGAGTGTGRGTRDSVSVKGSTDSGLGRDLDGEAFNYPSVNLVSYPRLPSATSGAAVDPPIPVSTPTMGVPADRATVVPTYPPVRAPPWIGPAGTGVDASGLGPGFSSSGPSGPTFAGWRPVIIDGSYGAATEGVGSRAPAGSWAGGFAAGGGGGGGGGGGIPSFAAMYGGEDDAVEMLTMSGFFPFQCLPSGFRTTTVRGMRRRLWIYRILGAATCLIGLAFILLPIWSVKAFVILVGVCFLANATTLVVLTVCSCVIDSRAGRDAFKPSAADVVLDLLAAAVDVVIGVILLVHRWGFGVYFLSLLVGLWLLFRGVVVLFASCFVPRAGASLFFLAGVFSVVLGIILLSVWPWLTGWFIGLILGVQALAYGSSLLSVSQFLSRMLWERRQFLDQMQSTGGV